MANKLTLLIDGNYMLRSRCFYFEKYFRHDATEAAKERASLELMDMLARSVSHVLGKFPMVDNLVITGDGGSWRKEVPVTEQMQNTEYKGNRQQDDVTDWGAIFKAFHRFLKQCKECGITVSQHYGIEGDDWMWFWTRKLNAQGTSCLIWSSDCDLKQLVQVSSGAFTAWWNGNELFLPQSCQVPDDPMEYFMQPQFINPQLEEMRKRQPHVSYINPDTIVIDKVLCGDAGDNIPAVVWYRKGTKTYRFSKKDKEKLLEATQIDSVEKLEGSFGQIAGWICTEKKFKPYNFSYPAVLEQLKYNLKVVWLNEESMPQSILPAMASVEYKQVDVRDLRMNFKLMLEKDDSIEDIFNEIG